MHDMTNNQSIGESDKVLPLMTFLECVLVLILLAGLALAYLGTTRIRQLEKNQTQMLWAANNLQGVLRTMQEQIVVVEQDLLAIRTNGVVTDIYRAPDGNLVVVKQFRKPWGVP